MAVLRHDDDDERRAQVGRRRAGSPARRARRARHGSAERADPQVARGRRAASPGPPPSSAVDRVRRARPPAPRTREPDAERQPQRLRGDLRRAPRPRPGAVQPRDLRGRAVGEEVADGETPAEHGRRERQRGELRACRGGRRSRCRRARTAARRPSAPSAGSARPRIWRS